MDGADRDAMDPGPERVPGETRARLLAVLTVVLVLAFLKWSQAVTMPLGFALFLIALAWPLEEHLERRLPRLAAFALTFLTLLAVFSLFCGALYWSGRMIGQRAPQYAGRLREILGQAEGWARGQGVSLPADRLLSMGEELAGRALLAVSSSVSLVLLVIALVALGLYEVHEFRARAERAFEHPRHGRELVQTCRDICVRYQRYLRAFTFTALLQGVLVWLFALLVGLDFALVWGFLAFLLNYLPTLGSVIAVIPPSLFALVQFQGFGRPLLVFLGLTALQLICGNYVDPLIQGRYLQLSSVVVLASILFWGWIWGIPGAFLGVPITVGLVATADHFPSTRWIARLLTAQARGKES